MAKANSCEENSSSSHVETVVQRATLAQAEHVPVAVSVEDATGMRTCRTCVPGQRQSQSPFASPAWAQAQDLVGLVFDIDVKISCKYKQWKHGIVDGGREVAKMVRQIRRL